jgi:hypothetical protein
LDRPGTAAWKKNVSTGITQSFWHWKKCRQCKELKYRQRSVAEYQRKSGLDSGEDNFGKHSVSIVRLRTEGMEFFFFLLQGPAKSGNHAVMVYRL